MDDLKNKTPLSSTDRLALAKYRAITRYKKIKVWSRLSGTAIQPLKRLHTDGYESLLAAFRAYKSGNKE